MATVYAPRRGLVTSGWNCARCWSGWTLGDIADGLDNDDEAEAE